MSAKKRRTPKRLPAIVPRFIKSAIAIGTIPALTGCFPSAPPVVAAYQHKRPKKQRPVQPPPADAGLDATVATPEKPTKP